MSNTLKKKSKIYTYDLGVGIKAKNFSKKKPVKYVYNFESPDKVNSDNGKKKYKKLSYNLGDEATVIHIPSYVKDPDALMTELLEEIPWQFYEYENPEGKKGLYPRLMHVLHYDRKSDEKLIHKLPELDKIKKRVEKLTSRKFKYAVLNHYRDGNDHIGYHEDKEVGNDQLVVSVTVGATRRFVLKHKFRQEIRHVFMLAHGDVLILNYGAIKGSYKHSVPKMANVGPRINITFRE